jgi:outer membrane lipoprotein-sorting protein
MKLDDMSVEMFGSFMFLILGFVFLACYAQRLYTQYLFEKLKEKRKDIKDISDLEGIEIERFRSEHINLL